MARVMGPICAIGVAPAMRARRSASAAGDSLSAKRPAMRCSVARIHACSAARPGSARGSMGTASASRTAVASSPAPPVAAAKPRPTASSAASSGSLRGSRRSASSARSKARTDAAGAHTMVSSQRPRCIQAVARPASSPAAAKRAQARSKAAP